MGGGNDEDRRLLRAVSRGVETVKCWASITCERGRGEFDRKQLV